MPRSRSTPRWAYALIPIVTSLFLAVPSTAAHASPADLCADQLAAAQAVAAKIDAHNARPHLFTLPRQQAAYNAYNAEARKLETQRSKATSRLNDCVEAMATLEDTAAGSPALTQPRPEDLKAIADATKQVPADFKPPAAPLPGKHWRVPSGSPIRPLYDALRAVSPENFRNVTLRGQTRPAIGSPDTAYPASSGRTIGGPNANGLSMVSPDHIIPLAEILYLRGFLKLTPQNMYQVVNARVNLQWLSYKANLTKSSRSASGMVNVDPQWQASQVQLERQVRLQLQDTINLLLRSQG